MDSIECGLELRLSETNRNDRCPLDLRALRGRAYATHRSYGDVWTVDVRWTRGRLGTFSAIVFPNGRSLVSRSTTLDDAQAAADELARWMSEALGARICASEVKTINAVGRTETPRPIDLRALADALGSDVARYDPLEVQSCRVTTRRGDSYYAFESGKILVPDRAGDGRFVELTRSARERLVELMSEARELCSRFPKA